MTTFGSHWAILAAILAVIKPLARISDKIRDFGELVNLYRILEHKVETLIMKIEYQKCYDEKLEGEFHKLREEKMQIIQKEPKGNPNDKLRERCQKEVSKEHQSRSFYIPELTEG